MWRCQSGLTAIAGSSLAKAGEPVSWAKDAWERKEIRGFFFVKKIGTLLLATEKKSN